VSPVIVTRGAELLSVEHPAALQAQCSRNQSAITFWTGQPTVAGSSLDQPVIKIVAGDHLAGGRGFPAVRGMQPYSRW